MKRPLALLLTAASLLSVPLAQAQFSSALMLAVAPPEEAVLAGERLTFGGTATFTADVLVIGNVQGVPVTYTVSNSPEWATVVVSPQADVFPVSAPGMGLSQMVSRSFSIIVDAAPTGPDGAIGTIEITATAQPTMPMGKPATAKVSTPVRFDAGDEPCPEHEAIQTAYAFIEPDLAPPQDASPDSEAQDDGTTTVQSTTTTPIALPAAAVLGFGAVGAGVGLFLRKRRS